MLTAARGGSDARKPTQHTTHPMSTSRRTTPKNRSTITIEPIIPLQPRSGTGPTTDGRRDRPEPTRGPEPATRIPMIDGGGLGPKPGTN
mgnify:CR=1